MLTAEEVEALTLELKQDLEICKDIRGESSTFGRLLRNSSELLAEYERLRSERSRYQLFLEELDTKLASVLEVSNG